MVYLAALPIIFFIAKGVANQYNWVMNMMNVTMM